jgi:predicted kinase
LSSHTAEKAGGESEGRRSTSNPCEIVVLCGVPASGKSTLARQRYPNHLRISLDTLGSRNREDAALAEAIRDRRSIVVDNTNTTEKARSKYVEIARREGIPIRAVCLVCPLPLAIARNSRRKGTKEFVPVGAIARYYKIFEVPSEAEGFKTVEFVPQAPAAAEGGGGGLEPPVLLPEPVAYGEPEQRSAEVREDIHPARKTA